MHFAYPQWRGWLILALAVAALAATALIRKRRALRRLAEGSRQVTQTVRHRQLVKCGLLWLAAVLLGIALLGPQVGWIEQEIPPRPGRDVLIVLDVSRSMLAEDVAPNRLERAKADLRDLADALERIGGHRIGLIAFAERAAVLCPLTSDYRCFAEELSAASLAALRLRGRASWGDGTQISTALDRAGQAIDDDNAAYTDVLLISDGDDMARETLKAADALARRGIAVNTLGLGDPDHGSLIPVRDGLGRRAILRYREEPVYTHLQEAVLQSIAERARGRYFAVGTGYLELDREFGELLAGKENRERQTVQHERHGIHRFQWFLAPALLLLLLQWLLSETRRPRRVALEKPVYFHWVRRRSAEKQTMKALSAVSLSVILLASAWALRTNAEPSKPVDAWTAFRRGNELLSQAQQAGTNADPAWLIQAQRQYRACLAREAATGEAGSLFADARYNLEVAKLLLMQVSRSGTNAGQPDPESPDEGKDSASPDGKKDKNDPQKAGKDSAAKKDAGSSGKDAPDAKQETKEPSGQQKNADKTDTEKDKTNPEKNKADANKDKAGNDTEKNNKDVKKDNADNEKNKKDDGKDKADNEKSNKDEGKDKGDAAKDKADKSHDKAKDKSDKQDKNDQKRPQKSQSSSGSNSGGQKSQGEQGAKTGNGEPKQQKQPNEQKKDEEKENDKKPKKEKDGKEPEPDDAAPKEKSKDGKGAKSTGDQDSGEQLDKPLPDGEANRSSNQDKGTASAPSDKSSEDKRRGKGRGGEPDASGLFRPETPKTKEKQPMSGQGSQGDSAGGGASKDNMKERELDPATQAAVMRLQEAIKRIENRRGRRVVGPEHGPEDPAHMNRYRDW